MNENPFDATRALAWEWQWYRQSLVEEGVRLAALASESADDAAVEVLTGLAASCLASARRLAAAMREAGLPHVQVLRPLRFFFQRHIEAPSAQVESLALARVIHWRLSRRLEDALRQNNLSETMANAGAQLTEACGRRMDVISGLLASARSSDAWLARFREVDHRVAHELQPFDNDLSKVPGLGRELTSGEATAA